MHKKGFILFIGFKKKSNIFIFQGSICSNVTKIVMEHQQLEIDKEMWKYIFFDKYSKIYIFGHKFNFSVNIWNQNTETEKTYSFFFFG